MILHRERPAVQGNDASQLVVVVFILAFVVVVYGLEADAFQSLYSDVLRLQLSVSSARSPLVDRLGGVRQATNGGPFIYLFLSLFLSLTERKRTHPPLLFPSTHPSILLLRRLQRQQRGGGGAGPINGGMSGDRWVYWSVIGSSERGPAPPLDPPPPHPHAPSPASFPAHTHPHPRRPRPLRAAGPGDRGGPPWPSTVRG